MSEAFSNYAASRIYQEYKKRSVGASKPKKTQAIILNDVQDNSYSQYQSEKIGKKPKYNWSPLQNKRYIKFLLQFGSLFALSRSERKQKKVNLQMSRKVKTRTATQCHTHHQKMVARYGDIDGVITYFENLYFDKNLEGERKSKERQPHSQNEQQKGQEDFKLKSPTQLLAIDSLIEASNMIFLEKDGEEYEYNVFEGYRELKEWIDW